MTVPWPTGDTTSAFVADGLASIRSALADGRHDDVGRVLAHLRAEGGEVVAEGIRLGLARWLVDLAARDLDADPDPDDPDGGPLDGGPPPGAR